MFMLIILIFNFRYFYLEYNLNIRKQRKMKAFSLIFCFSCIFFQVNTQQSLQVNNVIVNFLNRGTETEFFLLSNLKPGIDVKNAWLAVGFNSDRAMVIVNNPTFLHYKNIWIYLIEWRYCSHL